MTSQSEKLSAAIKDPSTIYTSPQDVVKDNDITTDQKLKILKSWELDQIRLLDSESENMGKDIDSAKSAERLQAIQKAKKALS